jgi:hypothetical protein
MVNPRKISMETTREEEASVARLAVGETVVAFIEPLCE